MDWRFSSAAAQEWLVNEKQLDVFGMKLPTGFQLIGQVVRILPPYCTVLLQPSLQTETETKSGFGSGECVEISVTHAALGVLHFLFVRVDCWMLISSLL